jgi:hypothetical protein
LVQVAEQQKEQMGGRRPTIAVNVPTLWASNFLVLDSQLKSRTPLQVAASAAAWSELPAGSKVSTVRELLMSAAYWKHAKALVELLRLFSDAIHQLEPTSPTWRSVTSCCSLQACRELAAKHRFAGISERAVCPFTDRAFPTFDRCLNSQAGGVLALIYNAAYSAACAVDPYYAQIEEGTGGGSLCLAPMLSTEHTVLKGANAAECHHL